MEQMTFDHEEESQLMITTIDNPYNPKEEYDKWRIWDIDNGYNTEEVLCRFIDIPSSVDIDDEYTIAEIVNSQIYEFLEHDVLGVYKLV